MEMFFARSSAKILHLLCAICLWNFTATDEAADEIRPYEFSFNIVDFQHRYEKKDADGIITGEYGFITGDGVYHETAYATNKDDDFIITRMSYRRIKSLKDAQEIFKDRPEAAKKLVEALARACSSCKIAVNEDKPENAETSVPTVTTSTSQKKSGPILQETARTLMEKKKDDDLSREKNKIPEDSKDLFNERRGKNLAEEFVRNMVESAKAFVKKEESSDPNSRMKMNERTLEKMGNDLYYRFNYTITSHEHQEEGYRNGNKDGSYRSPNKDGVDTRVKYLSNEFGHQPNVSFVPSVNAANESQRLKGYSFLWYWS